MCLKFLDKYTDEGLLFLRVGLGIMFVLHGWPKMFGGLKQWAGLGMAMGNLGIGFAAACLRTAFYHHVCGDSISL